MARKKKPKECPKCGARTVIPIVYGYPAPQLWEKSLDGKVKIGGCLISDVSPNWYCTTCEHEWLVEPGPFREYK
jgi:hypothetical protein